MCKYRKKLLTSKQISDDIKQFSYEICQRHNVIIRYRETDKDHIHYMIETEPTMSVSKTGCNNYCNRELKKTYEWLKEVKAKLHREFHGKIKSATVSQVPSGKYYVSILVETEHEKLPHRNQNIGLDLGIKDLCITSDGIRYENPKIIKKNERKLSRLQRQLEYKSKWNGREYVCVF